MGGSRDAPLTPGKFFDARRLSMRLIEKDEQWSIKSALQAGIHAGPEVVLEFRP